MAPPGLPFLRQLRFNRCLCICIKQNTAAVPNLHLSLLGYCETTQITPAGDFALTTAQALLCKNKSAPSFCAAAIVIRAKVIVITVRTRAIRTGGWTPLVPFDASVRPAMLSSSSLVFKLFPKDDSLPEGEREHQEKE